MWEYFMSKLQYCTLQRIYAEYEWHIFTNIQFTLLWCMNRLATRWKLEVTKHDTVEQKAIWSRAYFSFSPFKLSYASSATADLRIDFFDSTCLLDAIRVKVKDYTSMLPGEN